MADGPIAARVSMPPRSGFIGKSPATRFREQFATAASAEAFHAWSEQPLTRMVADALREFALNQPNAVTGDPGSIAVQYGLTLGLSFAAQFLTDPSAVCPGIFSDKTGPAVQALPEMTFDTSPDSLFYPNEQEN